MYPSPRFSSGLELASLAVTSNVLYHSWAAISELYREINEPASSLSSVKFKISQHADFTILAFITKEHLQAGGGGLIPSSILQETFPLFQFLRTETNSQFSINKHAQSLFASIHGSLPFLQSQLSDSEKSIKPLIITGHYLGGSVASLFTLWLLNEIDFATVKRPLCITFGSPLIGDDGLQEAISKYSTWNSCFLHVVSDQDPVPRVLISPHNPPASESASWTTKYKPFGTFLLCSELGCACLQDPESILKLLLATYTEGPRNQIPHQFFEYGTIVEQLNSKVICKECAGGDEWIALLEQAGNTQSLRAGIIKLLAAMGLGGSQSINNALINETEKQERKQLMKSNEVFDTTVLAEMKIYMANLEWYKKLCKDDQIGYYDCYKDARYPRDVRVEQFKKYLTTYWTDIVDEVEKKPQKEGASFRTRWLFGGTNYRRMIEPLVIAEHYRRIEARRIAEPWRSEPTNYISIERAKERTKHFKQLEEWLNKEKKPAISPDNSKKQNVETSLTEDSCFWAHVEEALISCKVLSGRDPGDMNIHTENVKKFEDYVWGMLKNYAISPEIFLQGSSFMKWWEEYKNIIKETPYSSPLTDFLKSRQYSQYATGCL